MPKVVCISDSHMQLSKLVIPDGDILVHTGDLTSSTCFFCEIGPYQFSDHRKTNGTYFYNGIDRLDNSKGYTIENSVTCCGRCNSAKNDMSLLEFKELVSKIYTKFTLMNSDPVI